jgi:uncharacterized repeat protein (TIGR02059 family)
LPSLVIRRTRYSWGALPGAVDRQAPVRTAGAGVNASANITLTFNEALRAGPAASQFTALVNGISRVVNSVSVAGAVLTVVLASAVATGNTVVITYAPGATASQRLADATGNEADPQTFPTITV